MWCEWQGYWSLMIPRFVVKLWGLWRSVGSVGKKRGIGASKAKAAGIDCIDTGLKDAGNLGYIAGNWNGSQSQQPTYPCLTHRTLREFGSRNPNQSYEHVWTFLLFCICSMNECCILSMNALTSRQTRSTFYDPLFPQGKHLIITKQAMLIFKQCYLHIWTLVRCLSSNQVCNQPQNFQYLQMSVVGSFISLSSSIETHQIFLMSMSIGSLTNRYEYYCVGTPLLFLVLSLVAFLLLLLSLAARIGCNTKFTGYLQIPLLGWAAL